MTAYVRIQDGTPIWDSRSIVPSKDVVISPYGSPSLATVQVNSTDVFVYVKVEGATIDIGECTCGNTGAWSARQEVVLAAVLVPVACLLPVSAAERVLLISSVLLVLVVELLNSSVEAAVDRIGFDTHRLSKRAKDLGSAAVLVTLVVTVVVWIALAAPALFALVR